MAGYRNRKGMRVVVILQGKVMPRPSLGKIASSGGYYASDLPRVSELPNTEYELAGVDSENTLAGTVPAPARCRGF